MHVLHSRALHYKSKSDKTGTFLFISSRLKKHKKLKRIKRPQKSSLFQRQHSKTVDILKFFIRAQKQIITQTFVFAN